MPKPVTSPIARILDRIAIVGPLGCWVYPTCNENGYGIVGIGPKAAGTARTHRLMYEHMVGPIPAGYDIDHLCRVRACCNPAHLQPVDRRTNIMRGLRKSRQTHCKQGHPLSGSNLKKTERQRVCIACSREASKESQRRHREKRRNAKENAA